MGRTIDEAIYCLKAESERYSEVCEECTLYRKAGCDHCYNDITDVAIKALEELKEYKLKEFQCHLAQQEGITIGYNMAIDDFVEKLKSEILEEIDDTSERQKLYDVGSDMSITCSHIMGSLRDVHHRIIDDVAQQLKEGGKGDTDLHASK